MKTAGTGRGGVADAAALQAPAELAAAPTPPGDDQAPEAETITDAGENAGVVARLKALFQTGSAASLESLIVKMHEAAGRQLEQVAAGRLLNDSGRRVRVSPGAILLPGGERIVLRQLAGYRPGGDHIILLETMRRDVPWTAPEETGGKRASAADRAKLREEVLRGLDSIFGVAPFDAEDGGK